MRPLLALSTRFRTATERGRALRLRLFGIDAHPGCRIARGARISRTWLNGGYGEITLNAACDVREYALIESWGGRVELGPNTFVGPHAVLYGHGGIQTGRDVLISMHVCILSSNHSIPPAGTAIRSASDVLLPTRIGNDVWIGAGAVVLGGVTIGDGCIVGAGAVVTGDLPANSVALGVPARVVRQRG